MAKGKKNNARKKNDAKKAGKNAYKKPVKVATPVQSKAAASRATKVGRRQNATVPRKATTKAPADEADSDNDFLTQASPSKSTRSAKIAREKSMLASPSIRSTPPRTTNKRRRGGQLLQSEDDGGTTAPSGTVAPSPNTADDNDDEEGNEDDDEEGNDDEESNDDISTQSVPPAAVLPATVPAVQPTLVDTSGVTRTRITSTGENKYWMVHTRRLVANIAPSPAKKFVLYLPQTPAYTGSAILIEEDPNLQEMAVTRGGNDKYSKDRAACFNGHHRKAKSQLNRSIIVGLTAESSPSCMALNVMDGRTGPMTLHPDLGHLVNIEGLRSLLNSDRLYCDEKVHKLWVGVFASGHIYGSKRSAPRAKLDEMVDINYEAHARYEMILRLSCQGYRHGYGAKELAERAAAYRLVRKLVRKDRVDNLVGAEEKRLAALFAPDADAARSLALESGGLADTTDEEDDF